MLRVLSLYKEAFTNLQTNVWFLSVATLINRSGAMVLLFTSLYLTNDLHFTIAQAGMIMSFFGFGSVLGAYVGGWLTDRRNFFDIMFFSLIGSGFVLLLMLVVETQVAISSVIFFYAFICDTFRPASSAAIGTYTHPENRTRSVSLYRLAINLGFSVGPAIGGFIALHLGYKILFVIDSITSFAAAGILWFYLPRQKDEHRKKENPVLADRSTSAYRDFNYLFFIFLVSLYAICFFQLFASVPQYYSKVCKYNEDTIGLLLALNGVLVVLIEMPLIMYLEKRKSQKIFPYIIGGSLCIPAAFLILVFGQQLIFWAIVYTLIITLAEIFAMPFMMNYVLSQPKKERQGQYSALYSISYGIGNIVAPSLGLGIASAFGFDKMFYFFILLGAMIAGGFFLLHRKNS